MLESACRVLGNDLRLHLQILLVQLPETFDDVCVY